MVFDRSKLISEFNTFNISKTSKKILPIWHSQDLKSILEKLYSAEGIYGLLIEGGPKLWGSFFEEKLIDRIYLYQAPKIIGKGISFSDYFQISDLSKAFQLKNIEVTDLNPDRLIEGQLF